MITVGELGVDEADEVEDMVDELAGILHDAVGAGASVSFMWPFSLADAAAFWRGVAAKVRAGETLLYAAALDGRVVGTVSVHLITTPNQPHRFEVAKLLVHRDGRRRGVADALMAAAEQGALAAGRTVGVLDTVTGSAAHRLYRRRGWVEVGEIPDFALYPDGRPCPTTYFYKRVG